MGAAISLTFINEGAVTSRHHVAEPSKRLMNSHRLIVRPRGLDARWYQSVTMLGRGSTPLECPLWVKADICGAQSHVRFTPESGHVQCTSPCPLWANSGHSVLRQTLARYSITSSARASSLGGTSRPSVLAVCWLMTSSNLVACRTGKSAGFWPFRMRPV